MEDPAQIIASYLQHISYDDLNDKVIREVKRRLIDSIAVARGALNAPPIQLSRTLLSNFPGNSLTIDGYRTSPDFSAFYNTFMIRYLDFNDTYLSKEPLHPSDMFGALLAVGSLFDKSGKDLILATAIGYEVGVRLCDSTSLRHKGFDHVNFLEVATAAALAKLLNLDEEKARNAISLSIVPHVALRETRVGELSMWKAGAAAEASRNAVFSALLAMAGITGPKTPFIGKFGFMSLIAKDMDLKVFDNLGSPNSILRTYIKKYPVEYHAQAAVDVAKSINYEGEITKVVVETYEAAKTILADTEDKWKPTTKETADHSLPYIIAYTLIHKDLWLDAYDNLTDPKVVDLMKKIVIEEVPEYTKVYPNELPIKLTVYTTKGVYTNEVRVPRGHSANPMSDEEVEEKFLRLNGKREELKLLWDLENVKVSELVRSLTKS
ncbi:MAG: MmgE/PrpD family protein [Sulfolobaceae archaeon]|nr:MmgE/PrpD family protein [Sulfolobaceae archaeon]